MAKIPPGLRRRGRLRFAIARSVTVCGRRAVQVDQHVPLIARAQGVRRQGAAGVPCSAAFEARLRRTEWVAACQNHQTSYTPAAIRVLPLFGAHVDSLCLDFQSIKVQKNTRKPAQVVDFGNCCFSYLSLFLFLMDLTLLIGNNKGVQPTKQFIPKCSLLTKPDPAQSDLVKEDLLNCSSGIAVVVVNLMRRFFIFKSNNDFKCEFFTTRILFITYIKYIFKVFIQRYVYL